MNIVTIQSNYERRGFDFSFFDDESSAIDYIQNLIPEGSSIGFGGSETVKEIGLLNALPNRIVLHRDLFDPKRKQEILDKMHFCDWYVSSANALCSTGDIVNIDGRGNRVGEIVNGPKNILIIAGINKIVNDISEGIERTRNIASPKNCRRLHKNTPCATLDKCCHCNSIDTICNATVILHHPMTGTKVHIVLINKNLGY
ncbi:MAG: lactate utilization protein [Clostridia bacterium]|nr:lactate utilization protein [Clostridia bacterium]